MVVAVVDIVEVVVVAVEAVTNHIATQVAPDQITNKLPVLDFRRNMKLKQVVFFCPNKYLQIYPFPGFQEYGYM